MAHDMNVALDSGVTAREFSEIITHLVLYSGWANAMSAVSGQHSIKNLKYAVEDDMAFDADRFVSRKRQTNKLD
jgi:4-carboxymuconolactone decarboxylase